MSRVGIDIWGLSPESMVMDEKGNLADFKASNLPSLVSSAVVILTTLSFSHTIRDTAFAALTNHLSMVE